MRFTKAQIVACIGNGVNFTALALGIMHGNPLLVVMGGVGFALGIYLATAGKYTLGR